MSEQEVEREELIKRSAKTGEKHEFKLGCDMGEIHVVVLDHQGHDPVPDMDYEITGEHGVSYSGKTGRDGKIDHPDPVPIDHYKLRIDKTEVPIESRKDATPLEVRLPGWPECHPIEMSPEADVIILRKKSGSPPPGYDQDVPCFRQGTKEYNEDENGRVIPLVRGYATGEQKTRSIVKCGCGLACLAMALAAAGIRAFRFDDEKNDWVPAAEPLNPRNLADFFLDWCEQNCKDARGKVDVWKVFRKSSGALSWGYKDTAEQETHLAKALTFLATRSTGQERKVGYRFIWLSTDCDSGKKLSELNENLLAGRPVILLGNHGANASGHYVLGVGYRKEGKKFFYYANDPARQGGPNPYQRAAADADRASFTQSAKSGKSSPETKRSQCHDLLHGKTCHTGPYTQLRSGTILTGLDDLWDLGPWCPT